ncbi:MAG TPA: type II secretion system F family protein [Opitutaceae bacterium]|nr:type II secretion system F family protein [Opitutaceae bacterium]
MPRFAYKARDQAGQAVESAIDAPNRKDALRLLSARGLSVAAVSEAAEGPAAPAGAAPRRRAQAPPPPSEAAAGPRPRADTAPRRAERLPFLESLHDLTSSGMSAGEAVRLLSIRIKEPRQRMLCEGLWARLSEGAPLSRAMEAFPEVFDSATVNLIHSGEATGSLNDTLSRLIEHLTEQRELRAALMTAMAYPVLIVAVSFGVILFFLFFLLPRLQTLLNSLGGKMPVSTQILIGSANFVLHYGIFVALAAAAGLVSFWRWRATEAGREKSDAWLLRMPLVGPFIVSQTVLEFSQTLGVLLQNGITAADALRMTERQIENRVHRRAFGVAIDRVLEGESLSSALTRTGCFPELVLDRVAIGENTGNVVPSLKDIAATYQKGISRQLNMFTKVIAGVILTGVFILVGFIAVAMVMAVFQVSASFNVR